jgi:hypothetical protein
MAAASARAMRIGKTIPSPVPLAPVRADPRAPAAEPLLIGGTADRAEFELPSACELEPEFGEWPVVEVPAAEDEPLGPGAVAAASAAAARPLAPSLDRP